MKYYTHLSTGNIQTSEKYTRDNNPALFGINARDIHATREIVSFEITDPSAIINDGSTPFVTGNDGLFYVPVRFHSMQRTSKGGTFIEASNGAILVAQSLDDVSDAFNKIGQEAPPIVERHKPLLERLQDWRQARQAQPTGRGLKQ